MKKTVYLSLIGALLPLGASAAEGCGTVEAVSEQISQAGDNTTAVAASLAQSCPELAEAIISQAIEQNPELANELLKAVVAVVPEDMIANVAAAALKAVPENMRAQLIATAIEASPTSLAQSIVDAFGETGLMSPTDILIAAIQGGADPATISEPTAAGIANAPPQALADTPLTLATVTTPGSNAALGAGSGGGGGTASPN